MRDLTPMLEREVEVAIQGLLDIGEYIVSAMGGSLQAGIVRLERY